MAVKKTPQFRKKKLKVYRTYSFLEITQAHLSKIKKNCKHLCPKDVSEFKLVNISISVLYTYILSKIMISLTL